MAGIKSCIDSIKSFPAGLKSQLIRLSNKYKKQGMSEIEAGTEAVLDVHKELFDELNGIKRQAGATTSKYSRPDVAEKVNSVKEKQEKAKKQKDFEEAQVKRNAEAKAKRDEEINSLANMGKSVRPESLTEQEYLKEVFEESTNPAQIAGAWLQELENNTSVKKYYDEGSGSIQDMIYAFFKNGGKLSRKSFKKYGDKNNLNIPGKNTYFSDTGKDADTAISINDNTGEVSYVSPQDVVDFIMNYPKGIGEYESKFDNNMAQKLHGKFIRLTGKRLNQKFAKALFNKYLEIEDKKDNELPPLTKEEVNEELEKDAAREKQFAETGQFQKKMPKSLSPLQLDAIKALENGEYVYFQIEQDDSIVELKSPDEIIFAGENGYNELEISKEKIDDAIPYSELIGKRINEGVNKVVERMKEVLPKFKISYNSELDAAGRIDGNNIEINPLYADIDTPIHEAGHALIDFIGYKNRVIQAGIKQLRGTQLYKDVAANRPELEGELLDKEVMAEAIGKEGEGIFEKESEKSKFKAVLDYIFTKLKQLLGIDKNIAKSLAKQIIGGIKTKDIDGTITESFQAKKKSAPLSPEAQKIKDLYESIKDIEDLSAIPYEDLIDAYNYAVTNEEFRKSSSGRKAQKEFLNRIGANFFQRNSQKVQNDPKYSPEAASKTDIGGKDILFKALSHFTAEFPELKGLSEMYNKAMFKKITESTEKQNTNRKLAIEVIKDRNSRLGVVGAAKENVLNLIFGNRNFKYFDYLEGKDGKFITVDEAKKKNLSKAQIDYLKFVRNTVAARAKVIENLEDNWNNEMEVLKTDKKFYESAVTENSAAALSHLLGNTWNIANTRIKFTNPNTGKEQIAEYGEIEKIFTNYANKGVLQKVKANAAIIKYNMRARRQLAKGINVDEKGNENSLDVIKHGDYALTREGKLISKFDRKRSPSRAYSKDFYSAINDYIDDTEHIQHMQPLIPIIHAIDVMNRAGIYEKDDDGNILKTVHGKKPNVVEWLNEWSNMHVYKNPKQTIPELDASLRFFRNAASMSMMMFNVPAQLRNIAMGVYNAWRKENGRVVTKGLGRLFGGSDRKINSDFAYGSVNAYALELIRKFKAVSTDVDSNPIRSAGGLLTSLGYAGTKWGEFLVQGSHWLGTMSDKDYNSFTWKKNKFGVDELVFKDNITDQEKEAIEGRLLDLVDKVSDVQGKYSQKDRRNIQNVEWGKSMMQYRVWLPDWWRIRFSKDAGSWRNMFGGEISQLKKNFAKAAAEKGALKAIWEDKNTMSNLKEVMMITGLFALMYQDDDDEEKSFASKQGMKMLSEMVGVVDPSNMKQIIERPIASMGVVVKFLDAADHLIMLEADDFYKKDSKYGKKGTPKIVGDIRGVAPGKQAIDAIESASSED